MALLKETNTEFGIIANYWNIGLINEDFKNEFLTVVVNGYVNKEMRDENHNTVISKNIQFSGDEYIKDATRETVYLALKAKDFSDAEDA